MSKSFLKAIQTIFLFSLAFTLTSCWNFDNPLEDLEGSGSGGGGGTTTVKVTSITLDKTSLPMHVGDADVTLTATVAPDDATDKTVTWSSDKEAVATVDATGKVHAVAIGIATITATANDGSGIKATCDVSVLPPGALAGVFSVSATKKVWFSQGNLQATYDGTKWTWAFAEHQWDFIGKAAGNTKVTDSSPFISENATVDLFGWVGASSTWTGAAQYGITSSTAINATDGYGNVETENLKADWGTNMGAGWRTLTGGDDDEWEYLFNTRATATTNMPAGANSSEARYTKATVAGVSGVILFPDDYAHPDGVTVTVSEAAYNTGGKDYNTFTVDATNWSTMEAAGCVFLPAAGYRKGTTVYSSYLNYYWSSLPDDSDADNAYNVRFTSGSLTLADIDNRYLGCSVRLVRDVE